MVALFLWLLLLILSWPLALIALIIFPIAWLVLLPFRLLGFAVGRLIARLWAVVTLPMRLLRRRPTRFQS